ncbi:MAG: hypothetical protein ACK53X_04325, partial [Holosporales bacterium]
LTTLSLNSFPYAFRIFVIIGLPYHNLDLIYWPEFWGVVQGTVYTSTTLGTFPGLYIGTFPLSVDSANDSANDIIAQMT